MGIIEIVLVSIFIRNVGIYGCEYVPESLVASYFPIQKNIQNFDVSHYEKLLLKSGLFRSAEIKCLGEDTVDVIVAVREVKRFSITPISGITSSNDITSGLRIVDRFLFGGSVGLTFDFLFINMTKIHIIMQNYRKFWRPVLSAGVEKYRAFTGDTVVEISLMMGTENSEYGKLGFLAGPVVYDNNMFTFCLESYFDFLFKSFRNKVNTAVFLFPGKSFFTADWMVETSRPFKFFILRPALRLKIQGGRVPPFKHIVAGGYNTMLSYPFNTSSGKSGYFLYLSLLYPMFFLQNEQGLVGILAFSELGNTFNSLDELTQSDLLAGVGLAIGIFSRKQSGAGIYISTNRRHEFLYGLYYRLF